ncbi:hypothetical protein I3842_02G069000 [Carya illinoinensis]|uniref:Uncharacterized protein n=1 Tax=Carya illinoinensis TaxID=32201 RepID=A0A922JYV0_CARIL|nr:hypothetical protein I3842_02G069000 [Carya illinoinensis]
MFCFSVKSHKLSCTCSFYYLRLEHCGAVPLESCTTLLTPSQQCLKEAYWKASFVNLHTN